MKTEYKCFKPLKEIRKNCKVDNNRNRHFYRIYHSSGAGGGIHVPIAFVEKYFGTGKPCKVQYRREKESRKLYMCVEPNIIGNRYMLYNEWFESEIGLDDDLFEI